MPVWVATTRGGTEAKEGLACCLSWISAAGGRLVAAGRADRLTAWVLTTPDELMAFGVSKITELSVWSFLFRAADIAIAAGGCNGREVCA